MLDSILSEFPQLSTPIDIKVMGNAGGFSGARLWRIETDEGSWCLRRWPQSHPTPSQLSWIHQSLYQAADSGCDFLPLPLLNRNQGSHWEEHQHLWEIAPWLPGAADLSVECSQAKLTAAFQALARFHKAFPTVDRGQSTSLQDRHRVLSEATQPRKISELCSAKQGSLSTEIFVLCRQLLELARNQLVPLSGLIERVRHQVFDRQTCIRDIWHQHLLFSGDNLSGIVDFGAMRVETICLDVARLLGSLQSFGPPQLRQFSLDAYRSVRPLSETEIHTIDVLIAIGPVVAGLSWLRWLLIEKKEFDSEEAVISRLATIRRDLVSQIQKPQFLL